MRSLAHPALCISFAIAMSICHQHNIAQRLSTVADRKQQHGPTKNKEEKKQKKK